MSTRFRHPNDIRADFSARMSAMYRAEVPAYNQLVKLVDKVNAETLSPATTDELKFTRHEDMHRISQERHCAIRIGTSEELSFLARIFAVMGMYPVGYYDLTLASVPVHSTAFRPISPSDLEKCPFRVFTSLLRLELVDDASLRAIARSALTNRKIFSKQVITLTQMAETDGGLSDSDAKHFVTAVLQTFRWHPKAHVDVHTFNALNKCHRLIADVASFKGPHINHLTPRVLDIDAAQNAMIAAKLPTKAIIEGPPRRACPIVLRQTSFKAFEEAVDFPTPGGGWQQGSHVARFGEIEQRGAALTQQGHRLYDQLLANAQREAAHSIDEPNSAAYADVLQNVFSEFPDTWRELYDSGLSFFKFSVSDAHEQPTGFDTKILLDAGVLELTPITYEDFLPVSAAGIFQSNLGNQPAQFVPTEPNQELFEAALGQPVINNIELYRKMEQDSLSDCLSILRRRAQP